MGYLTKDHLRQLRKIGSTALRKDGVYTVYLCGKKYKVYYEAKDKYAREERDFSLLKHLAVGKTCILDIGSNVGISSLLLAEDNQALIYAFEASEESANLTIRHGVLNGISDRLVVINALLTERSGDTLPFYWEHTSAGSSIHKGYLGHSFGIQKNTLSVDDFVTRNGIRPELIKVDIEGAEGIALKGTVETMKNHKPLLMVELHSYGTVSVSQNAQDILKLITQLAYQMVYLKTMQVVQMGEEIHRGRCHVLLCPVGFDYRQLFHNYDHSGL